MPRLVPVEVGETAHLDAIIKGKRKATRARLKLLRPTLGARYTEYSGTTTAFEALAVSALTGTAIDDCVGCYDLDCNPVAALKQAILDARPVNRRSLCQWCLVDTWSDLDHYAPLEVFPEFSVMARNLAPCCSKCNKSKSSYWPLPGIIPEVLSLYYSSLLDRPHLGATVTHALGGSSTIEFFVRHDAGLADVEIVRLERHYARLQLMRRLRDAGISALSRFRETLRAHQVPREDAVQYLIDEATGLATAFGANHYEALTASALAAAPVALDDYLA